MPRRDGFVVGLYSPCTHSAFLALQEAFDRAGFRTAVQLPDPAPVSKLKYGVLPYGWLRLSLRNGKEPTREVVEQVVDDAFRSLRKRFGDVALELNGTLIGSIPPSI